LYQTSLVINNARCACCIFKEKGRVWSLATESYSIAGMPAETHNQFCVTVVVNNSPNTEREIVYDNLATLSYLQAKHFPYELLYIDASSSGFELPLKSAGVGLARKIGMDRCLSFCKPSTVLCSLDADTLVNPDYLQTISRFYVKNSPAAAVVGFKHLNSSDLNTAEFIKIYERYIRETAEQLNNAGSPYGYHAIGSTITCTAESYAAVGGMPRKTAGEDFYFLQEIAKYRSVDTIPEILVYPSARLSKRVHLGTGVRMQQALDGFNIEDLFYNKEAFTLLGYWLSLGINSFGQELSILMDQAGAIHPELPDFLKIQKIEKIWDGLQKAASSPGHFTRQFHRWFDALKTMKFLKKFS